MQLQAERDHFVRSGIGGSSSSSSSSSPSCSPPKNLSFIKVNNLKKPRQKAKEKDLSKQKPVSTLDNSSNQLTLADAQIKVDVEMTLVEDIQAIAPIENLNLNDLSKEQESLSMLSNDIEMPSVVVTDTSMDSIQQPSLQFQAQFRTTAPVAPPPPPPPPPIPSQLTIITNTNNSNHYNYNNSNNNNSSHENVNNLENSTPIPIIPKDAVITISTARRIGSQTPAASSSWTKSIKPSPRKTISTKSLFHTLSEPCTVNVGNSIVPGYTSDHLSMLPFELFFNVLCQLDALDLSRVAQVNKFCSRMVNDNGVWRVKSMQHPLFSNLHIRNHKGAIPWMSYYKYLHRNNLLLKQNWADARPQAIHVLKGHTGLVSSLEMSVWSLVTASIDSTLRVWDLRTMQCIQVLRSKHSLTCVAQSEIAGAACARTSFGGLCIWSTRTGDLILQDDTAMPHTCSFMYMDGRYIGYGQSDGAVTVFDWSSRTSLKIAGSYHAHEGDVIHISILDDKYVISASTNGETLVYSLKQSRIIERILLPHATQAIQFTPTLHEDKVMFSTRDAVYEYELMLDHLKSEPEPEPEREVDPPIHNVAIQEGSSRGKETHVPLSSNHFTASNHLRIDSRVNEAAVMHSELRTSPVRATPSGRIWKASNSLLSQIRQRVGAGKPFDQERLIIPTRFPRLASIYCVPRTIPMLEHGTTSARDSYGVFMPNNCTHLHEMSVYTRATKQVKQINGPAVEADLMGAIRNRFYTTMECNMHCAVVSSGNDVYVISFLPSNV